MGSILIPLPPDFNFKECLFFLDRGYDEVLYTIDESSIIRAVHLMGFDLLIRVSEKDQSLFVEVLDGEVNSSLFHALRLYVIDWFDLSRDLESFYPLLKKNPGVASLEQFRGLYLIGIPDLFEGLCWCIIGQQINLTFAYKIKRRLVMAYGRAMEYDGNKYFLFPSASTLANVPEQELRAMQFSRQKIRYITLLSRSFSMGQISKRALLELPSHEARRKRLLQLTGVGVWTANYVLMKTFRDPNSVPYGDAGLIKALIECQIISDRSDVSKMEQFFDEFPEWKSYVAFYLWRSLY